MALGLASPLEECGNVEGRLLDDTDLRMDLTLSESFVLRVTLLQSEDIILDIVEWISLSTAMISHLAS